MRLPAKRDRQKDARPRFSWVGPQSPVPVLAPLSPLQLLSTCKTVFYASDLSPARSAKRPRSSAHPTSPPTADKPSDYPSSPTPLANVTPPSTPQLGLAAPSYCITPLSAPSFALSPISSPLRTPFSRSLPTSSPLFSSSSSSSSSSPSLSPSLSPSPSPSPSSSSSPSSSNQITTSTNTSPSATSTGSHQLLASSTTPVLFRAPTAGYSSAQLLRIPTGNLQVAELICSVKPKREPRLAEQSPVMPFRQQKRSAVRRTRSAHRHLSLNDSDEPNKNSFSGDEDDDNAEDDDDDGCESEASGHSRTVKTADSPRAVAVEQEQPARPSWRSLFFGAVASSMDWLPGVGQQRQPDRRAAANDNTTAGASGPLSTDSATSRSDDDIVNVHDGDDDNQNNDDDQKDSDDRRLDRRAEEEQGNDDDVEVDDGDVDNDDNEVGDDDDDEGSETDTKSSDDDRHLLAEFDVGSGHYSREDEAALFETDSDEEEEEEDLYLHVWQLLQHLSSIPHHLQLASSVERRVLPPKDPNMPLNTLVLDLDETLLHSSISRISRADFVFQIPPSPLLTSSPMVWVRLRPGLHQFLEAVSLLFEVVIFTASHEAYASPLLDILEQQAEHPYIHQRLYRNSCLQVDDLYLKELSVLNRPISNVLIIDNSPTAFALNIDNGVPVRSWFSDPNDTALLDLLPFLKSLTNEPDVRSHIQRRFHVKEEVERAGARYQLE